MSSTSAAATSITTRASRVLRPRVSAPERPPCFSASLTEARAAWMAGMTLKIRPVRRESPSVKRSSVGSRAGLAVFGQAGGNQAREDRHACLREKESEGSAGEREHGRFGDHLADQSSAACAQCGAHRQFLFSGDGAGEKKTREVRAGDQQDASGGGH